MSSMPEVLDYCEIPANAKKKTPKVFIAIRRMPENNEYEIVVKKVDRHKMPVNWETLDRKQYADKKVALAWYAKTVANWR